MTPTGNWLQHGRRIDPPLGYRIEDYFRDGRYLGPDADGIAPELSFGFVSTHAFHVAFAAAQLSARIESGQIAISEKIAAAAVGMADAEAEGIDWGQVNFDDVCDRVAEMIRGHLVHSDADLEDLRRDAAQMVRKEARRA
jgi:hypothetical protein